MLLFAVGIVYVKAYMNMAQRNSKEPRTKRYLILRILGGFWAIMAIIMGGLGVYMIAQMSFPKESIEPFISPNMILRSSEQTMYWGYATYQQSQCISMISGVFESLALSAYCFMFKTSNSKWYSKIGKIVFCILFFGVYTSATDFHYFDLYEWFAPVLFGIMAFFALRNNKDRSTIATIDGDKVGKLDSKTSHVEEAVEFQSHIEDDSKYMPHIEEMYNENNPEVKAPENVIIPRTDIQIVEQSCMAEEMHNLIPDKKEIKNNEEFEEKQCLKTEESIEPVIRFCRYCGKEINYQSGRYCKHCGKELY